jgi:hypothetical protein
MNDRTSPLLRLELEELELALATTGAAEAEKWWDIRKLFNTRSNRWRMALGALSEWISGPLVLNMLPQC